MENITQIDSGLYSWCTQDKLTATRMLLHFIKHQKGTLPRDSEG
jgi:hypothetical protein